MKPKKRVAHHRIMFVDPMEIDCVIMAELGWTTKAIAKSTGLTECQVGYRIKKAGVKRADYRSGSSETAGRVLKLMRQPLTTHVFKDIAPKFR